jgi:20S proteasome alpha/beta subunit
MLFILFFIVFLGNNYDTHSGVVHAYTAAGMNTLIGIVGDGFVVLAADDTFVGGGGDIVMKASGVDKIAILEPYNMAAAVAGNMADADHIVSTLQTLCRIHAYQNSVPNDVHFVDCSSDQTKIGFDKKHIAKNNDVNDDELTVECIAHAARNQIARRMNVCMLIAGTMRDKNDDNHLHNPIIADPVRRQIQAATSASSLSLSSSSADDDDMSNHNGDNNEQPALFWLDEYGSLQRVLYGAHGYASSLLWSVLDRGYRHNHMGLDEVLDLLDECLTQLRTRYVFNSQPLSSTNDSTTATKSSRFCIKCIDANGIRVITR